MYFQSPTRTDFRSLHPRCLLGEYVSAYDGGVSRGVDRALSPSTFVIVMPAIAASVGATSIPRTCVSMTVPGPAARLGASAEPARSRPGNRRIQGTLNTES